MGTSALKSASLTSLALTPPFKSTTGEGSSGYLRSINDYVTTVSADAAGSTYKYVRVPTNAKVKHVFFEAGAMTAGKVNIGVYYSSDNDGTQPALQGTVAVADFFASDVDCASAVPVTDVTNESGTYTADKHNKPLWEALGLASDPGGFFDVVATVHTTAVTTGALTGVEVQYVE